MGRVVRLIGSGLGLAAEAMAANKERKERCRSQSCLIDEDEGPRPALPARPSVAPTLPLLGQAQSVEEPSSATYGSLIEVDDEQANELIAHGHAVPVGLENTPWLSCEDEAEGETDSDDNGGSADDEAMWALDDAVEKVETPIVKGPSLKYSYDAQPTIGSFSAQILAKVTPPPPQGLPPLPLPVIIPQRRPGKRDRGFIHAYAPLLADKGISQDAFLLFIRSFQAASQASPLWNVVNLSGAALGFVPHHWASMASTAIQLSVEAAIELQTRHRTHSFLDEMNTKLFEPRGLYALIMQYLPHQERPVNAEQLDINDVIRGQSSHKSYVNFRSTVAASTYGTIELPESAPLVFPALDKVADSQHVSTAKKLGSSMDWVGDYFDKRARAHYINKNPTETLSLPIPTFHHRLSDPSHPAYQGSILTLVSGGRVPPIRKRTTEKGRKLLQTAFPSGYETVRDRANQAKNVRKRVMKKNVLYLLVVELPGEEDLRVAKEALREINRSDSNLS